MTERTTPQTDPTKAAHDPETPDALIAFMSRGWEQAPIRVSQMEQQERFRARRAALSARFPGEYLIVPAGREQVRANDTNFRFRTASDYAYLVGPGEPGAALALEPAGSAHRAVLFVPPHNRGTAAFFTDRVHGELWVGRHRGVDESQLFFGVDGCRAIGDLDRYLTELRESGARIRGEDDEELVQTLAEMRLVKDAWELDELRTCVAITKRGFEDVIRLFPRLRSEREIEAAFWSRARIEASDVGYLTIAAAGDHACTLHWNRNDGAVEPGALLLLDAGVEAETLYTADVTRTLPISGTFSPEQRAVYDIVYAAQEAGFAQVKPGNDFLEPNRAAMRVLTDGLRELGVLTCSVDEALDPQHQYYRRYTLHGVSHMLGIDVHDCAKARSEEYRYGRLRTGMVLTVEPGLYFQRDDETVPAGLRGIGVRIEDDLAVTETGCENLSAILPRERAAVERWISELQTP